VAGALIDQTFANMEKTMRRTFTRSIAAVLAVATVATLIPLAPASAAGTSAAATSDLSARRHIRGGNAAVALGAFALIAGVAIAASKRDNCGPYGCGYGYGYAPGPYYGGYRPGYYHRWHHRHWR
jgi:hypothetical protein